MNDLRLFEKLAIGGEECFQGRRSKKNFQELKERKVRNDVYAPSFNIKK